MTSESKQAGSGHQDSDRATRGSGVRRAVRGKPLIPLLALGFAAYAGSAEAEVIEPDGRVIPQWGSAGAWVTTDVSQDVIDCCQVAADGSSTSLQALFDSRGEQIDWLADAHTEPSYFSPLCGFQGTLVLRGGGCKVDFGWYNVNLDNPAPPADAEIFPLVSVADVEAMFASGVYDGDIAVNPGLEFRPRVGDPPIPGAPITDIRNDPRYAGGLIGLATKSGAVCTQTHYSEARLNDVCTNTAICAEPLPWIMAVMYTSTATPNAFYLAFEDLPTSPTAFDPPTPPDQWGFSYNNDGDFNDFVYFVEGITCEGGGLPCLTSAEGACGYGLTECLPDGTTHCVAQLEPSAEVCDNIDNDCNGLVDDGDLCEDGYVCSLGVCRPNCSGGEFPCESPLVCNNNTGICVDPACLDVQCEAGTVCVNGQCMGGCEDVACPWGQVCQLGRCVDPCINRVCSDGMVCEGGVCVESCQCRVCGPDMECNYATGQCVRGGCTDVVCPEGQMCEAGACVDACANVVCPGGADCINGWCGEPLEGAGGGTGDAGAGSGATGAVLIGPDGGVIVPGTGGSSGSGSGAETDSSGSDQPGCGCRAAGSTGGAGAWALLLMALGGLRLRRRR